ncbi:MAG: Omp28-related outer membrane protein [Bacteroidales bacterium]|nr:Omp28-related outer membrane protein [Bacteroidales bacterium]
MKRLLFAVAAMTFGFGISAQTIVSTQVQKRNAVIEEYTGVNCTWCPDGHKIAQQLASANPGKVIPINIHVGGYAALYKTQWGDAILNQTNCSGFPAGSVNRIVSSCKVEAYSRGDWATLVSGVLAENSPVNIAATAKVDAKTRKMTIHVEVYYTADVEQNSNRLNVVLLQNNILGPQTGGANLNPAQMVGDKYSHMHMFRDMITGNQWGDEIAANEDGKIEAGTFVEKDYVYEIPEVISNEEVVLGDLDVALFVTDDTDPDCAVLHSPNIWTGIEITPEYENVEGLSASLVKVELSPVMTKCNDEVSAVITVRNMASTEVTSMKIEYGNPAINQPYQTYNWTGNISLFDKEDITLPNNVSVAFDELSTIEVMVSELNGEELEQVLSGSATITKPSVNKGAGNATLICKTDQYASEFTWNLYDESGNIVQKNSKKYSDGKAVRDTILLTGIASDGCYSLEILDAYGDGCPGGNYKVVDANGKTIIKNTKGTWGSGEQTDFTMEAVSALSSVTENIYQTVVYPNPARENVTLTINALNSEKVQINVVDLMGRVVVNLGQQNIKDGANNFNINTSALDNGVYYVRIISDNGISTSKLSVTK